MCPYYDIPTKNRIPVFPIMQLLDQPATSLHSALTELDLTDEHLMRRIAERDEAALGALYDRYAGTLKALIMRVLHNDADSDDMVQEIFVEIWNRAESYDASKGKPLGWCVTLARRRAIDRLRKRDARSRAEERLTLEVSSQPDRWIADVSEELELSDVRQTLQKVMETLPAAQKQAVELAFYKGMSQREIAAHTGIPLGTIKTRLELALKKISAALQGVENYL